jgi:hypothetical protein
MGGDNLFDFINLLSREISTPIPDCLVESNYLSHWAAELKYFFTPHN